MFEHRARRFSTGLQRWRPTSTGSCSGEGNLGDWHSREGEASQAFWEVDDVETEDAELEASGVVFEEYDLPGVEMKNRIATGGGAKTAWFKDPDGNILAVSQRLAPRRARKPRKQAA